MMVSGILYCIYFICSIIFSFIYLPVCQCPGLPISYVTDSLLVKVQLQTLWKIKQIKKLVILILSMGSVLSQKHFWVSPAHTAFFLMIIIVSDVFLYLC